MNYHPHEKISNNFPKIKMMFVNFVNLTNIVITIHYNKKYPTNFLNCVQ